MGHEPKDDDKIEELKDVSMQIMDRLRDIAKREDIYIVCIVATRANDEILTYLDFSNTERELHQALLKSTSDDYELGRRRIPKEDCLH